MRKPVKDIELCRYLEGKMTESESRDLRSRLKENGELGLLYHLEISVEEHMRKLEDEILGPDDLDIVLDKEEGEYLIAARSNPPKKND